MRTQQPFPTNMWIVLRQLDGIRVLIGTVLADGVAELDSKMDALG